MGRKEKEEMTWLEKYAEEQCAQSPEFKAVYEEETALLALIRARNAAELSQKEVAEALHVSQPYIAQVERGTRPMSMSMMMRYANVVGVTVQVMPRPQARNS